MFSTAARGTLAFMEQDENVPGEAHYDFLQKDNAEKSVSGL